MAYVGMGAKEISNLGKGKDWEVYNKKGGTSSMTLDLFYLPLVDTQRKKIKIVFNLRIRFGNSGWYIEPWGEKLAFGFITPNNNFFATSYDIRNNYFYNNSFLGTVRDRNNNYITTGEIDFNELNIIDGSAKLEVDWSWDCKPTSYANFSDLSGTTTITIDGFEQLPSLKISSTSIKVLDESAYLTIGKSSYSDIELRASSAQGSISLKKLINTTSKAQTFYFKEVPKMYRLIPDSKTSQKISFSLYSNNKEIAKLNNITLSLDTNRDRFESKKIVPSITYEGDEQYCSFSLFGGFWSSYAEYGLFKTNKDDKDNYNYQVCITKDSKDIDYNVSLNYNITSKNEAADRTNLKATGRFPLRDFDINDYSEKTFKIQLIDCKGILGSPISFKITKNKTNEITNFKAEPYYSYENGNSIINAIGTDISFTVERVDIIKSITLLYDCIFYDKDGLKITLKEPFPQLHYSIDKEKIKESSYFYKKFTEFQFINDTVSPIETSTQLISEFMKTKEVENCDKIKIKPKVTLIFDDDSKVELSGTEVSLPTTKERIKAFSWDNKEFQFNIPVRRDYLNEEIAFPCGSCFSGMIYEKNIWFSVPINIPLVEDNYDLNKVDITIEGTFYVINSSGIITYNTQGKDYFIDFNNSSLFQKKIGGISENSIMFIISAIPGVTIADNIVKNLNDQPITVLAQKTGSNGPTDNPLKIKIKEKTKTNE